MHPSGRTQRQGCYVSAHSQHAERQGERRPVEGFFLLEKFIYNDTIIPNNAVIFEIDVNNEKYEIVDKLDFYIVLNALEKGDNVKVSYKVLDDSGITYEYDSRMFEI